MVMASETLERVATALKEGEVLRVLSMEACLTLARAGAPLDLASGALLCQAGDPGDAVFLILDGEIEIRTSLGGGRDVRFVAFGRGALIGEMAVIDGGPRSTDMAATRRSRLWRIPRAALLETLESEPKAAVALLVVLSARLRRTNAALEAMAGLDLGGRLARSLLAEQSARGLVGLTQSELARRVGASREKVNRKLNEWAGQGWVELSAAGVRLTAPDRLQGLVSGGLDG
ncbi:MAG TPA: Crp/Fnr family transcriptional regulator [Phenylobacterium sp.]|uniref:Crp/Fnr family transcriptional regulator n=1 Tax=Phenylobacterium sp. TaxID=1871053 RepID=UPI002C2DC0C4|nr:Crp/Fnr family transcriptional regulator [Phenylobacterium sp.]HSV03008.1 Crp/Fnr family transcriptional regulator [Phenylobacterium sp.]